MVTNFITDIDLYGTYEKNSGMKWENLPTFNVGCLKWEEFPHWL